MAATTNNPSSSLNDASCSSKKKDMPDHCMNNDDRKSPEAYVKAKAELKKGCPSSNFTYDETKSSKAYNEAKALLKEGDFENALKTIENTIEATLKGLPPPVNELDESLAPLYYLYGTTLLYSVEESSSMVVSPDEEGSDIQIAWENLDSARTILEKLEKPEDLAQVYVRLGDLQRSNGNLSAAVKDYESCLELRMKIFGLFHRSVADCQYSLGMTCVGLAAQNDKLDYKTKSMRHYFECGRSFSALIAKENGLDADSIATVSTTSAMSAEKESEIFETGDYSTLINGLSEMRSKVKPLVGEKIHEWKEILDEIQETMENLDESIKVLQEANKEKEKARNDSNTQETSNTTIGFSSNEVSTSVGFGSSSLPVQPNMLTIKKKKRVLDKNGSSKKLKSDS